MGRRVGGGVVVVDPANSRALRPALYQTTGVLRRSPPLAATKNHVITEQAAIIRLALSDHIQGASVVGHCVTALTDNPGLLAWPPSLIL